LRLGADGSGSSGRVMEAVEGVKKTVHNEERERRWGEGGGVGL